MVAVLLNELVVFGLHRRMEALARHGVRRIRPAFVVAGQM